MPLKRKRDEENLATIDEGERSVLLQDLSERLLVFFNDYHTADERAAILKNSTMDSLEKCQILFKNMCGNSITREHDPPEFKDGHDVYTHLRSQCLDETLVKIHQNFWMVRRSSSLVSRTKIFGWWSIFDDGIYPQRVPRLLDLWRAAFGGTLTTTFVHSRYS